MNFVEDFVLCGTKWRYIAQLAEQAGERLCVVQVHDASDVPGEV